MSRRTGNNYSGPRWAFAGRPARVAEKPAPCEHDYVLRAAGAMGGSGRPSEPIFEARCQKCGSIKP